MVGRSHTAHCTGPAIRCIYELRTKTLEQRSKQLLMRRFGRENSGAPFLKLAMVSGPIQQILRPAKLECAALKERLHQHALFGADRFFDSAAGLND